ncbi:hypothetical protein BDV95DRAFT_604585 [Massariosphaeria phaeospora]|uniref:RanBP2-type domain-containing protein n=1 Tax=Massariosphaeria phaeospora TaxID=100035 RepID=A0A7C8MDN3_9PLEO|nr:hypothetical protein BDV95DRAFT_604585 [Massariosphaeria phaeospora]
MIPYDDLWFCDQCGASNLDWVDICPVCGMGVRVGYSYSYGKLADLECSSVTSDDANSIFSTTESTTTNATSNSSATDNFFLQEVVKFLWHEPLLQPLCIQALRHEHIGHEKFHRKYRQLLLQFTIHLNQESEDQETRRITQFIQKMVTRISRAICTKAAQETDFSVNQYDLMGQDESSGDESETESAQAVRPETLSRLEHIIASSLAIVEMHRSLFNFVQPTFRSELERLVEELAPYPASRTGEVAYRVLTKELCDILPSNIKCSWDNEKDWINKTKWKIELWTSETWDWWPMKSVRSPLGNGQARVVWKCNCGRQRWMIVPSYFADHLTRLVNQFTVYTSDDPRVSQSADNANESQPPQHQHVGTVETQPEISTLPSTPNTPPSVQLPIVPGHATGIDLSTAQPSPMRVMLVASVGYDHLLTQIPVHQIDTGEFFKILRLEYSTLFGFLRRYFSIWRFSHCDFYKFEKFDEFEFSPRAKDEYPDASQYDYDYQPRPMCEIPRVTPHEFYTRFYSCTSWYTHFTHFFHRSKTCKCNKQKRKCHNRELLEFLPKKLSMLDERSDQREMFWGLYVRQAVCFRWILFYNLVCMLPLIWFFLMWMFVWGHDGDLQNAFMPMSIMLALLSVFWSTFLGSLNLGREG